MPQYELPGGRRVSDPYADADIERDLDRTTPPTAPHKVAEDQALFQGSGSIAPVSRVRMQLRGETNRAAARKRLASRRLGGKR